MDACLVRLTPSCTTELTAPGTAATQATMSTCAQALGDQDCTEFRTLAPPECLLAGTRGNGTGCEFSSQCVSTFCDTSGNACGQCGNRVPSGGSCASTDDLRISACQLELTCSLGHCVRPVALGGACTNDTGQCLAPYACLGQECTAPVAVGSSPCNPGACVRGASCNGAGACEKTSYQPVGVPCDVSFGGKPCLGGGYCADATGQAATTTGTCVADVADGQACMGSFQCTPPSTCVRGMCQGVTDAATCP
jgi:hypothetical protein